MAHDKIRPVASRKHANAFGVT